MIEQEVLGTGVDVDWNAGFQDSGHDVIRRRIDELLRQGVKDGVVACGVGLVGSVDCASHGRSVEIGFEVGG